ncbi:MAG TPA: UDP-N-acetylglucosamine 2-epimerase (non-hydrolyzing) [Thermoleophilia bacterium]|nr:UDP-N-acetylglucosamine 2-epimerase (non-hydrolyzing) [Thermoleophilia bacterium]
MRLRILHVVGARPNFMKTAPIMAEMSRHPDRFEQLLVHTGQHYDYEMSEVFFEDLGLPEPDVFLGVGSGSHAEQTARTMVAFERVVQEWSPSWVFVVGDVNSTLACALVCAKLEVPVAHVEAGLRSRDRTMPEEINRVITDQLADLLFTPSRDADANLRAEGVRPEKIHFVGNVMIDSLVRGLAGAATRPVVADLGLEPGGYVVVTLHRPSNVDDMRDLKEIIAALRTINERLPVVFPLHPRTRQSLGRDLVDGLAGEMRILLPLGYLDFIALLRTAGLVITDSGGLQEETTYLGIPCLTVRTTTERPVTIEKGTNRLVERSRDAILAAGLEAARAPRREHTAPELWDGHTAARIVQTLARLVDARQESPATTVLEQGL